MRVRVFALFVVLAIGLLVLSACGGGASTGTTQTGKVAGNATTGKTKFDGTCSACHGTDAKGIQGLGKDLTVSTFVKGQSDADLVAFIKKGRSATDPANSTKVDMPPKGGNPALTDQDLADIVAYVRTLQK